MTVWETIGTTLFGACLGFVASQGTEYMKNRREKKKSSQREKGILLAIREEVVQGLKRCEILEAKIKSDEISFSRIYTSLWDSLRSEVAATVDSIELLRAFHSIYYFFDLVNCNMDKGMYGPGAGMAATYLPEIRNNLEIIDNQLGSAN